MINWEKAKTVGKIPFLIALAVVSNISITVTYSIMTLLAIDPFSFTAASATLQFFILFFDGLTSMSTGWAYCFRCQAMTSLPSEKKYLNALLICCTLYPITDMILMAFFTNPGLFGSVEQAFITLSISMTTGYLHRSTNTQKPCPLFE